MLLHLHIKQLSFQVQTCLSKFSYFLKSYFVSYRTNRSDDHRTVRSRNL